MKAQPVLILKPNGDVAVPIEASDLGLLAKDASMALLAKDTSLQTLDADFYNLTDLLNKRWSKVLQQVTADLTAGHGTGMGVQGLIPVNVPIIHKITVIDAPVAGAVSLFFSGLFGDAWAVPVKTGDVFEGFAFDSNMQLPFSNTAAPGSTLKLLVQGW